MKKSLHEHITSNPAVLFGKPVITNTRIGVDLILEKLVAGDSINDLLEAYPNITIADIAACISFVEKELRD